MKNFWWKGVSITHNPPGYASTKHSSQSSLKTTIKNDWIISNKKFDEK